MGVQLKSLTLLLALGFLSACISTSSIDVETQPPVDVEDRAVVDGQALPLPEDKVVIAEPLGGQAPISPVVKRLMSVARAQRQESNWDGAAGSLERALRIEPRNAILWSRLSEIRFDQQAWKKAIQLAAKSNTLSGENANLRRQNWVLMASAYEAMGDLDAAQRFRAKLNR